MELIRAMKSEEVVFGKGFVPVLTASFAGTEEEIARFINLKKSGESIHMAIDPVGKVAFEGEKGQLSIDNRSVKAMLGDAGDVCQNRKIDRITEREQEIIEYVCQGLNNKEIAQKLALSPHTVKTHLHKIFQKLNVTRRSKLILFATHRP